MISRRAGFRPMENGREITVVWTKHALERQKEWEKKLNITKEEVETLLRNPEQIAGGDLGMAVAQGRTRGGLLRIPFAAEERNIRVITLYWTSRTERYWREDE
jgi:hypothetical protein